MYCPYGINAARWRRIRYVERAKHTIPQIFSWYQTYEWHNKPTSEIAVALRNETSMPYSYYASYDMRDLQYTLHMVLAHDPKNAILLHSTYRTIEDMAQARTAMINALEARVLP